MTLSIIEIIALVIIALDFLGLLLFAAARREEQ